MIKNDRQYRITRAQVARFERALLQLDRTDGEIHPRIRQAQRAATKSQLQELRRDLSEYEALKAGEVTDFSIESLTDLPRVLIQARIARGLTQKDLADRLRLKAQQIQRYEATDYASANLARLQQIAEVLGVTLSQELGLNDGVAAAPKELFSGLKSAGLDQRFVVRRLLPRSLAAQLDQRLEGEPHESVLAQTATVLSRIFGWSPPDLLRGRVLPLSPAIAGQARFKLAARAQQGRMVAYVTYAHYLATLVAHAAHDLPRHPIPDEWKEVRNAIVHGYGEVSFRTALLYAWDLGIAVLPLRDPGVFDAACWRIEGRNVIVLKQRVTSQSRWLFDLLHELRHAAADPVDPELAVIDFEESLIERRDLPEEHEAHTFAGDVILDGRAEELTQLCVTQAAGSVERLKAAAQEVAANEDVPVDGLANYLAFRLSLQGINWWGAAMNLQTRGSSPITVATDEFLKRTNLAELDGIERELVAQALRDGEDADG
ncbi:MAG: helix-turn-helix domain-containing protein [Actinomycetota bacterium]